MITAILTESGPWLPMQKQMKLMIDFGFQLIRYFSVVSPERICRPSDETHPAPAVKLGSCAAT
jgi:hypothetical protein